MMKCQVVFASQLDRSVILVNFIILGQESGSRMLTNMHTYCFDEGRTVSIAADRRKLTEVRANAFAASLLLRKNGRLCVPGIAV